MDLFQYLVKELPCRRMMSSEHSGHYHLNQRDCGGIQPTLQIRNGGVPS